jgi:hypothetical protein
VAAHRGDYEGAGAYLLQCGACSPHNNSNAINAPAAAGDGNWRATWNLAQQGPKRLQCCPHRIRWIREAGRFATHASNWVKPQRFNHGQIVISGSCTPQDTQ